MPSLPGYPAKRGIVCGRREIALATLLPAGKGHWFDWGKRIAHYTGTRWNMVRSLG